jgi:hypothetical protein
MTSHFLGTAIIAAVLLVTGGHPAQAQEAQFCCLTGLGSMQGPSTVKISLRIDDDLPRGRPIVVLFSLPVHNLGALRDALTRDQIDVIAVDHLDRQVLGPGALTMIENIVDQATNTLRLKAIFASRN